MDFDKFIEHKNKILNYPYDDVNLKKIHNYEIPFISLIDSSCLNEKYINWAYSQTFFSNS